MKISAVQLTWTPRHAASMAINTHTRARPMRYAGICRYCRENARQCKQCRNINYENLDAFICNECGYCKYAKFEYTLTAKPAVVVETIASEVHTATIAVAWTFPSSIDAFGK